MTQSQISLAAGASGKRRLPIQRIKSHPWIAGGILLVVILAIALPIGLHFGLKKSDTHAPISVSIAAAAPSTVFPPIAEAFVSFAIEFTSFPKFAGESQKTNSSLFS